ncbi:MAG: hypothetical protein ACOC3A_05645 [Thermodesulfobacteriota bacterium]
MANSPRNRIDDWMELILLNWSMIALVMFYSIVLGIVGGSLLIITIGFVLEGLHIPSGFLALYPTLAPASRILISVLIAAIFIFTFRSTRYDCLTGQYFLKVSLYFIKKPALRLALFLVVLSAFGIIIRAA